MASRIRQNYNEDCEALVNKQINMELYASYVYMSMAYFFDRDDIAHKGFSVYFKKNSDEEREHGEKFMKYQNRRGGKVVFQDIAKPTTMEWGTPLEAMEAALELEKTVSIIILTLIVATTGLKIDFPLLLCLSLLNERNKNLFLRGRGLASSSPG